MGVGEHWVLFPHLPLAGFLRGAPGKPLWKSHFICLMDNLFLTFQISPMPVTYITTPSTFQARNESSVITPFPSLTHPHVSGNSEFNSKYISFTHHLSVPYSPSPYTPLVQFSPSFASTPQWSPNWFPHSTLPPLTHSAVSRGDLKTKMWLHISPAYNPTISLKITAHFLIFIKK